MLSGGVFASVIFTTPSSW